VTEWEKGKMKVIRRNGRCELVTNFLLSKPEGEDKTCARFCALTAFYRSEPEPTIDNDARALKLASHIGTRYSVVYDLAAGQAYAFFGRDFAKPMKLDLARELKKGPHEITLPSLFGSEPERLAIPEVVHDAPLSASEILKRAQKALGGMEGAASI